MKKLISTFAVLALALIIPTVTAPSANAATISCNGTTATIVAGDTAGDYAVTNGSASNCASLLGANGIRELIVQGSMDDIRGTLVAIHDDADDDWQNVTSITLEPTGNPITVTQNDLNYIAYLARLASNDKIKDEFTLDAGGNDVVLDSSVTGLPDGMKVKVIGANNESELAKQIDGIPGIPNGNVTIDGKTVDAIIAAADAANAGGTGGAAGAATGEKAVTNTSSAPVNGFALIAFAAFALAGVGFASRKIAVK